MTDHLTPSAPGAREEQYRIKPLVWVCSSHDDGSIYLRAGTPFGTYKVSYEPGQGWRWGYCFDEYYDEDDGPCDGEDDGMDRAWANWLERISDALEPTGRTALSEAGHE
ncbi:hypothetical protein [Ancylobacter polymorphus]|uniref:Uncharacterized protein n=1 Tax=Ancylobacter polymorphus TaxID=223390 RepID=A0ABU0BD79_9HYPH|nr:hypothetical protein [Ancylobacter polymorphus]MDQ0303785.1 hypothetical protein [Ancylobacter polymorphus]